MSGTDTPLWMNPVLIVVGWITVHLMTSKRDKDKLRRELIIKAADTINEQISKMIATSIQYHTNKREAKSEIEINISLKDISSQLHLINEATNPKRDGVQSSRLHKNFKQAITAKHFEDEHIEPLEANGMQLSEVAALGLELKAYFSEIKYAQFA
jgi:predicted hydrolase (HD superfamily)